jgi:hypothetical protein
MKFNFFKKKKPEPQRRAPRKASNAWLRKVAKDPSSKELVERMVQTNPVIQAAIIEYKTGITIDARDIRIFTPLEALQQLVTAKAIKNLTSDAEFISMVEDALVAEVRQDYGRRLGLGKGQRGIPNNLNGPDGSPYVDGGRPMDILTMIDTVERLRARVGGGGGTLATLLNSPVAVELVKTIIPLLVGSRNGQSNDASANYWVGKADGSVVEMNKEAYDEYLKQASQLTSKGAAPNAETGPKASSEAQSQKAAVSAKATGLEQPPASSIHSDNPPLAASPPGPAPTAESSNGGTAARTKVGGGNEARPSCDNESVRTPCPGEASDRGTVKG